MASTASRRTVQEKITFIDAWSRTGEKMSQRQFCFVNGLHPPTFNKWLAQEERLRETAHTKKNAQRTAVYMKDTNALRSFVRDETAGGNQVTVPDLLAFAKHDRLLQHTDVYMTRYMFCRRVLFGYMLLNPVTPSPRPLVEAYTLTEEGAFDEGEDGASSDGGDGPNATDVVSNGEEEEDHSATAFIYVCAVIFPDKRLKRGSLNCGRCGCGDDCAETCINRACAEECSERNCSRKGMCSNRWVGKTVERLFEVFDTGRTGWGLRTRAAIPVGKVVLEYCGEYMTNVAYRRRCQESPDPVCSTYYMECDKTFGIDARVHGNLARFINHGCSPNLKPMKRIVDGTTRVFFVTSRQIEAREEVTFNYGTVKFECGCVACW